MKDEAAGWDHYKRSYSEVKLAALDRTKWRHHSQNLSSH